MQSPLLACYWSFDRCAHLPQAGTSGSTTLGLGDVVGLPIDCKRAAGKSRGHHSFSIPAACTAHHTSAQVFKLRLLQHMSNSRMMDLSSKISSVLQMKYKGVGGAVLPLDGHLEG